MKKLLLIAVACLPSALCLGGDSGIRETKEWMRQFKRGAAAAEEKQRDEPYRQANQRIQKEDRAAQLRKLQAEQQKK